MISSDVEYWIQCIDDYDIKNKTAGRRVLIWGAYSKAAILCDAMNGKGIQVEGYIDGHKEISTYLGKSVYKPQIILHDKGFYVIVAIEGIRHEIKQYLSEYGTRETRTIFIFPSIRRT